ncbi:hypothetical protein [Streptomyces sp. NPDC059802]|uniref:hypothetical protein n=1 Tax=Streptomyces sp. NPDC059802 TaxID=3346952 RepID=UPI0036663955
MRTVASWPPVARDTLAVVEAYTRVLGWPLLVGTTFVPPDRAAAELTALPDILLSTPCSAFDAVKVSHAVGMEAMVLFGRRDLGPVPCLVARRDHVILLVQAGTGGPLSELEGVVSVEAGPGGRLVLPPSSGHQWDTPPWAITSEKPCRLPEGRALAESLVDAQRLFGGIATSPRQEDSAIGRASAHSCRGTAPPSAIHPAGSGSS